ncbi:PsbP-related protein [Paenibacillus azoreducens]|uniref:PsbP C-terminal domain-containing protein n=1 Tax=Paenibacillus azoreducens TaxID=116718 RepID=A0A919YK48_9BACL|nr:PsbP-related protein [Paenibacillus azoreducens]GIO50145.1 hypothetical protein J34TS1_49100 [Paenibacillus azoreducens]
MKKSIVLILSLCLLLTACGSKEKDKEKTAEESKTTVTQEAPKETTKETPKETSKDDASKDAAKPSDDLKTKKAEAEGFSFEYPESWQAYDLSELNQPMIKAAYADPAPKVAFADNVNVTSAPGNSGVTAKAIADLTVTQYESGALGDAMKDFKKISYDDKDKNSGVLIGEYTQGQSGIKVVLTQYIITGSPNMYTLSISYTKESYDNGGKEMAQKMLDSFTVNKK